MNIQRDQYSNEAKATLSAQEGDFAGGLNENDNIGLNQSPDCLNVYADDDGTIKARPKNVIVGSQAFLVKRAFPYSGTDNVQRLACTDNDRIRITTNLNTFTLVPDVAGTGDLDLNVLFECRMTSYHNALYWTNGQDEVGYWDGGSTSVATGWFAAGDRPRYIAAYSDRIWFWNTPTNQDYLYYTALGAATFSATNLVKVDSKYSGQGCGLAVCQRGLIAFKNDSCFLLTGYSEATFNLIPISLEVGCINADSIQERDDGWIMFMSRKGMYRTDGISCVPVPDLIPKSKAEITQMYVWNLFEDSIVDTQWEAQEDASSTGTFIPSTLSNGEQTQYFLNDHLYTKPTSNGYEIPDGYFGSGQGDWEDYVAAAGPSGTITYTPGGTDGYTQLKTNGGVARLSIAGSTVQIELYCLDTAEVVETDTDVLPILPKDVFSSWVDVSFNLNSLGDKYQGKRFQFIVTIIHDKIRNPLYYFANQTIATWTSPEFFIQTDDASSAASFQYRYYLASQLADPDYFQMRRFRGRCQFAPMQYFSETIPLNQNAWGAITYNYIDWMDEELGTPYSTNDVYMAFSDDAGATWHSFGADEWVLVTSGTNISDYDPFPAGDCNAVKFKVDVAEPGGFVWWPMQYNSITFQWYQTLADVPNSLENVSSTMWRNRYLLAYTKAGEDRNYYALTYDELARAPRFFKWYFHDVVSCFAYFAGETYYFANNYTATTTTINKLSEATGEPIRNVYYLTNDLDMGADGVNKDFDWADFVVDRAGETLDDLKIEVYVDSVYNGDVDFWRRKTWIENYAFLARHTALKQYGASYTYGNMQVFLPTNYFTAHRRDWAESVKKFGWGNRIAFKFIWGFANSTSVFATVWAKQRIRTIRIKFNQMDDSPQLANSLLQQGEL